MARYLIGTGGWAYFNVPSKSPLKVYSEIFNFVEVNYTFYKYPTLERVKCWRRITPKSFTFTVRCHQALTHRIGLKPIEDAYEILDKMIIICNLLRAPLLHLVTPIQYILNPEAIQQADDFFSSLNLGNLRIAWEIRSHLKENLFEIMENHNIISSVDLSRTNLVLKSKIIYSRLFGKGLKNFSSYHNFE